MKRAAVHLTRGSDPHVWCSLVVSLQDLAESQLVLQTSSDFRNAIEPADDAARSYTLDNWTSGIISGAQYALRKAHLAFDKGIVLHELAGRLAGNDIQGLSLAATLAVMRLCEQSSALVDLQEWSETPEGGKSVTC